MNEINDTKQESLFELAKQETGTRGHSFNIHKKHTQCWLRSIHIANVWNSLPTRVVISELHNNDELKYGIDDTVSSSINQGLDFVPSRENHIWFSPDSFARINWFSFYDKNHNTAESNCYAN